MSWLNETWKRNKGALGKIASVAAPIVAGAFGGPLAGAAVSAGLRATKKGANFGNIAMAGGLGYLSGGAGSGAKAGFAAGGLTGAAKGLVGMGAQGAAPYSADAAALGGQAAAGGGGGILGRIGQAGGWLKDGKNLSTAVAGVQTLGGLADAAQERKLQNRSMDITQRRADDEDRLRDDTYNNQQLTNPLYLAMLKRLMAGSAMGSG